MGHPTKVQLIKRTKGSDQWYITFPSAIAEALDFQKSEVVEWTIHDRSNLILSRAKTPKPPISLAAGKKKPSRSSRS